MRLQARFIDLGALSPEALHAAYCGLATVQSENAEPILVWARSASPHLCIGQSQTPRSELDIDACARAGVGIVRRPLGGGTVLVDGDQRCVFFILPRALPAARPARIFGYCLEPLARTFARFGIAARNVGRSDLWCGEAKIAGSGAATLGDSMVLGTSFVLRFPHALFASLVRAPSADFREWLHDALPVAFAPWEALESVPSDQALMEAMHAAVEETLDWNLCASAPSAAEAQAMRAAEDELQRDLLEADDAPGQRRVDNGIKLNAVTFLTESRDDHGWLRVLLRNRLIERIAAQDVEVCAALQVCIRSAVQPGELRGRLERVIAPEQARLWAETIARTTAGAQGDDAFNEGDDQWRSRP